MGFRYCSEEQPHRAVHGLCIRVQDQIGELPYNIFVCKRSVYSNQWLSDTYEGPTYSCGDTGHVRQGFMWGHRPCATGIHVGTQAICDRDEYLAGIAAPARGCTLRFLLAHCGCCSSNAALPGEASSSSIASTASPLGTSWVMEVLMGDEVTRQTLLVATNHFQPALKAVSIPVMGAGLFTMCSSLGAACIPVRRLLGWKLPAALPAQQVLSSSELG